MASDDAVNTLFEDFDDAIESRNEALSRVCKKIPPFWASIGTLRKEVVSLQKEIVQYEIHNKQQARQQRQIVLKKLQEIIDLNNCKIIEETIEIYSNYLLPYFQSQLSELGKAKESAGTTAYFSVFITENDAYSNVLRNIVKTFVRVFREWKEFVKRREQGKKLRATIFKIEHTIRDMTFLLKQQKKHEQVLPIL